MTFSEPHLKPTPLDMVLEPFNGSQAPQSPGGRQNARDKITIVSLLAANLLPVLVAIALGWGLGEVVVFYWWENLIIGVWVIPRILLAQGSLSTFVDKQLLAEHSPSLNEFPVSKDGLPFKYILVPFFCFHYYFFCFVHGMFVVYFANMDNPSPGSFIDDSLTDLSTAGVLSLCGMMISHGISFFRNYVGKEEYRRSYPALEMFRPYPRIIVLHLGIMVGAFATLFLGSPQILVVALMLGKTFADYKLRPSG